MGGWTLCPAPADYCTYSTVAGTLLCIGNIKEEAGKYATVIWVYSEESDSWLKFGEMPEYLTRCTSMSLPTGEVVVIGSNPKYKWLLFYL